MKFIHFIVTLVFLGVLFGATSLAGNEREATLDVHVDYVGVFNPENATVLGNMTYGVYVGTETSEPFAMVDALIPLTSFGGYIVDPSSSNSRVNQSADNVPGLHIYRGSDDHGNYILFGLHGGLEEDSRETIIFNISLGNAIITDVQQETETTGYEEPTDGICGIFDRNDVQNQGTNDEWYVTINGTEASFCAGTNIGNDRVKVYYEYMDSFAPVISDVSTSPSLPHTNFGDSESFTLSFNSTDYPINMRFELKRGSNSTVDTQVVRVENVGGKAIYNLPANLALGTYRLYVTGSDDSGNSAEQILLGTITVESRNDDNDGGDNGGGSHVYRSSRYYTASDSVPTYTPQAPIIPEIKHTQPKTEESNGLFWVIMIFTILNIILLLLVLLLAARRD